MKKWRGPVILAARCVIVSIVVFKDLFQVACYKLQGYQRHDAD